MKKTFEETKSFLMELKSYQEFYNRYDYKVFAKNKDLLYEKIRLNVDEKISEKLIEQIQDLLIDYMSEIETINFTVGFKFGFLFYEEIASQGVDFLE